MEPPLRDLGLLAVPTALRITRPRSSAPSGVPSAASSSARQESRALALAVGALGDYPFRLDLHNPSMAGMR